MMSVHVDDVFMAGKPDILEKLKELIKFNFNIPESVKRENNLGIYYELGHDENDPHTKITMEKEMNKLVNGY